MQGEVTGLDGNDYISGRPQRVKGQQAHRRGTIDYCIVVAVPHVIEGLGQAGLALANPRHLLLKRGQIYTRRSQFESVRNLPEYLGQLDWLVPASAYKHVVYALLDLFFRHGKTNGTMRLRVHIDKQHSLAGLSQSTGQIYGYRCFATTTFLINNRYGLHSSTPSHKQTA